MDNAWDSEAGYGALSAALAEAVQEAVKQKIPIGLNKSTSNLFRERTPVRKYKLDVRRLDRVLRISRETMTADVEGMTTYETLVEETLKFGLLPTVVPELKTITIGGAVSGLGIESSSFKYGLVHEGIEEFDILTGDGRIVTCSSSRNPDLFFGFPNSYGTLGYALRLKLRLVPVQRYVHVAHSRFSHASDFFSEIGRLQEDHATDFLEGTVFSRDEMYISRGRLWPHAPQVSDYTQLEIYYRSIQRKEDDWLTTKDYVWRWDTDWFWCSKHFGVQIPFIRFFARGALHSRNYQRLMRASQRLLPKSAAMESVIQDVQIPFEHAEEFFDFILAEVGITPVWVCPFKTSDCSYDLCTFEKGHSYVNFGFWDQVPIADGNSSYVKAIEQKIAELGGAKGLYSTSRYDRDTFWSLFNKQRYDELKHTYDPDGLFADLYAKCVGSV
jgi:FAD/FMN-containing dehydrogenase